NDHNRLTDREEWENAAGPPSCADERADGLVRPAGFAASCRGRTSDEVEEAPGGHLCRREVFSRFALATRVPRDRGWFAYSEIVASWNPLFPLRPPATSSGPRCRRRCGGSSFLACSPWPEAAGWPMSQLVAQPPRSTGR